MAKRISQKEDTFSIIYHCTFFMISDRQSSISESSNISNDEDTMSQRNSDDRPPESSKPWFQNAYNKSLKEELSPQKRKNLNICLNLARQNTINSLNVIGRKVLKLNKYKAIQWLSQMKKKLPSYLNQKQNLRKNRFNETDLQCFLARLKKQDKFKLFLEKLKQRNKAIEKGQQLQTQKNLKLFCQCFEQFDIKDNVEFNLRYQKFKEHKAGFSDSTEYTKLNLEVLCLTFHKTYDNLSQPMNKLRGEEMLSC